MRYANKKPVIARTGSAPEEYVRNAVGHFLAANSHSVLHFAFVFLMCPYYDQARPCFLDVPVLWLSECKLDPLRGASLRSAPRSSHQRSPGKSPEIPQRSFREHQKGHKRPPKMSPRELPERSQRSLPERPQKTSPEAQKEVVFGDPYWCIFLYFLCFYYFLLSFIEK